MNFLAQIPPLPELEDALDPAQLPPPASMPWWIWLIAALALVGLSVFIWLRLRNQPVVLVPDPRSVALEKIQTLEKVSHSESPYAFSIQMCDVLRGYCEKRFNLRATAQTSPEFLSAIRNNPGFAPGEQEGLAKFLSRCDEIKFGRAHADASDNILLADLAKAFVAGGPA